MLQTLERLNLALVQRSNFHVGETWTNPDNTIPTKINSIIKQERKIILREFIQKNIKTSIVPCTFL